MTTTHHLWAWPRRFAATSYVLRVTINAVTSDLTFPATGSLDPESDYWMLDDGDASDSLVKLLELCIESHAQAPTVTCSLLHSANMRLSILSSVSVQIHWTHGNTTLDKAVFGFNADETGTLITSNLMPPGLWRPRLGAYIDGRERTVRLGGMTRALSGATRVVQSSVALAERTLAYRYINKIYALDEYVGGTETLNSFEQLQDNGIMLGRKLRFCPNEEDRTAYTEYRARSLEDTLEIMEPPNLLWWRCEIPVVAV